jgi:hypothetical protein
MNRESNVLFASSSLLTEVNFEFSWLSRSSTTAASSAELSVLELMDWERVSLVKEK